jgi:hypothetical protein
MSFERLAIVGVVSSTVLLAAACGSTVKTGDTGTGTSGPGGATSGSASSTSSSSSSSASSSSSSSGIAEAGPDVDDNYPGPFPAPPQVVSLGGSVLSAPKFVPVFFMGDDATFVQELTDFTSKIGSSTYWAGAMSEYGIGAATSLPPIMLAESAPTTIDDTGIQAWLADKLGAAGDPDAGPDAGPDPNWPQPDANTVYVLYYPSGSTITLQGESSCTAFGGYHSDTVIALPSGNQDVSYAVVPRCSSFGALNGIDAVTGAASHELAEASSDPQPESNSPAYVEVDNNHFYWERLLGGGELGDMCAQFQNVFVKFPGLDYTVQRIWSNKSALAGHDPCQPTLSGEVYFNAAPVLTDSLTVMTFGTTVTVKGVKIAVGDSKTIPIELFSDGPMDAPWTVQVQDAQAAFGGTALLDITQDTTTGLNGDKIMATIKVMTAGKRGTESFIVTSTNADNTQTNIWFGIVGAM